MIDNPNTLIAVCCYEGDADRVRHALPLYKHHKCPVVILSPEDSKVTIEGCDNRHAGKRGYIGADTWTRQHEYFKILLTYPHKFFLINDSDSFFVSAELSRKLYYESEDTLWANLVTEPRPHASPYPKLAAQPPYFCTREALQKMVAVSGRIPVHPITPYVDFYCVALACEAGLKLRPFTDCEHASTAPPFEGVDPWEILSYRIRNHGTIAMHPIKTPAEVALCVEARKFYESSKVC